MSDEPTVGGFTFGQWLGETRHVRDALAALGVLVPPCLPGEEKDCGEPVVEHYMTYLAMINARIVAMAQANLTPEQQDQFTIRAEHFLAEYAAEDEQGGPS